MVINCQTNYIAQCIPGLSHYVRGEIEAMKREAEQAREFASSAGAQFDSTGEFFSRLCSEVTSVAFDINELANGSITRQDRNFNLGPRFLHAVESREAECRSAMPHCLSGHVAGWLTRELDEFRGVITNSDSMMHPIFRKAVREVCRGVCDAGFGVWGGCAAPTQQQTPPARNVLTLHTTPTAHPPHPRQLCFPHLRVYARTVVEDADAILKEVMGALVDERFGEYHRLVEALKRDVALTQAAKRAEAEALITRLLESEVNWICVNDVDLKRIQKEVEAGLAQQQQQQAGQYGRSKSVEAELWGEDLGGVPEMSTEGAGLGLGMGGRPLLQSEDSRELRAMQLALHAYIRLLLRRIFYAVPMNVRNVIMNEFRQDLVQLVAEKYNDEAKLRTLMSEEMWVNHKRQQRGERRTALEDMLRKLDLLS